MEPKIPKSILPPTIQNLQNLKQSSKSSAKHESSKMANYPEFNNDDFLKDVSQEEIQNARPKT